MEALLTFALLVIAGVLFYRFVERRHKVVLAKVAGVLLTLGLITIGGLAWKQHLADKAAAADSAAHLAAYARQWERVQATYLPESTRLLPKPSPGWPESFRPTRIAFRLCNVSEDTVDRTRIFAGTWAKGHSGRTSLGTDSTGLETDMVLAPASCAIAVFEVTDLVKDSVAARVQALNRSPWNDYGDPWARD